MRVLAKGKAKTSDPKKCQRSDTGRESDKGSSAWLKRSLRSLGSIKFIAGPSSQADRSDKLRPAVSAPSRRSASTPFRRTSEDSTPFRRCMGGSRRSLVRSRSSNEDSDREEMVNAVSEIVRGFPRSPFVSTSVLCEERLR
eukprot:5463402-Prymnesium_polylepis.2